MANTEPSSMTRNSRTDWIAVIHTASVRLCCCVRVLAIFATRPWRWEYAGRPGGHHSPASIVLNVCRRVPLKSLRGREEVPLCSRVILATRLAKAGAGADADRSDGESIHLPLSPSSWRRAPLSYNAGCMGQHTVYSVINVQSKDCSSFASIQFWT